MSLALTPQRGGIMMAFRKPAPVPARAAIEAEMLAGPYARFWRPQMAPLPTHVVEAVAAGPLPPAALLPFSAAPTMTDAGDWPVETGYTITGDGEARVFVRTLMPGVTPAMWDWWFGWHAGGNSARYRLWHPQAHVAVRWSDGDDERVSYLGRTSVIDEYIGATFSKLTVSFVPPQTLGFDSAALEKPGAHAVICARGGAQGAPFSFAWLIHHVRAVEGGSEMRSRFWLGGPHVAAKPGTGPAGRLAARVVSRLARQTRHEAVDLLVHCAQEMNHLAALLPGLYAAFCPAPRDAQHASSDYARTHA
jgi:hypothetical protein